MWDVADINGTVTRIRPVPLVKIVSIVQLIVLPLLHRVQRRQLAPRWSHRPKIQLEEQKKKRKELRIPFIKAVNRLENKLDDQPYKSKVLAMRKDVALDACKTFTICTSLLLSLQIQTMTTKWPINGSTYPHFGGVWERLVQSCTQNWVTGKSRQWWSFGQYVQVSGWPIE